MYKSYIETAVYVGTRYVQSFQHLRVDSMTNSILLLEVLQDLDLDVSFHQGLGLPQSCSVWQAGDVAVGTCMNYLLDTVH